MSKLLTGNISGLRARQRKQLERLAGRNLRSDEAVPFDLAERIGKLSGETGRVIGVLVNRRGRVEWVIVGDDRRLYLPDIGRTRGGGSRLRGLRLIRTRFRGDLLAQDDLSDLSKLQLDMVISFRVEDDGYPGEAALAHLVPDNPERRMWRIEEYDSVEHCDIIVPPFISALEEEFERKSTTAVETGGEAAMLVYVKLPGEPDHEARVAELLELCRTAEVEIVETATQSRRQLDPRYAVGSGFLEEVEQRSLQLGADILIFGQDLSPSQMRNIAERTYLRVVDRTQLILDIFAQRARTRGGKLQVELAQLQYTLPRLHGRGTAMSRLAGGIGGRGPGETKLEVDRRRVRDRIRTLEKRIDKLSAQRELRRKNRRSNAVPVVSIVGYTNAGKSTLLNTLTHSEVLSEDKLFATLDPTSRRLRFPEEREIVLTDTVGFIQDLPDELAKAFRATLEELEDADLLLHVIDASDPAFEEHIESTESILRELELDDIPRVKVFNKVDRLDQVEREDIRFAYDDVVLVSALRREDTTELIERLDQWLIRTGRGELVPDRADGWDEEE